MRRRLLATAFAVNRVLPAGLKRAVKRAPIANAVRDMMRRNSVDAVRAYDGAALRMAVAARSGAARIPLDVSALAAVGPDTLGAGALDGSAADELAFVNGVNMLYARGVRRMALLPSDTLVSTSKQAWVPFAADGNVRTRVLVHNYFGKNYVIDDAMTVLFFVEVPGRLVFVDGRLLAPDETIALDLASLPDGEHVPLEAGASLVAVALHPGLARVPTKEFRYVVSIEGARSCGVVHSLPAVRFSVAQPVSVGTKAYATPVTERVHVVKSAGDPGAALAWDGARFEAAPGTGAVGSLPSGGAWGWGGASFTFQPPMRTAQAFYVGRSRHGEFFVQHDQGAHPRPPKRLAPSTEFLATRNLVSLACPLLNDRDVDLGLVVDARNSLNTYRAVEVAIRDDAGKEWARERFDVTAPLFFIDVASLRRRAGLDAGTCGYAHLTGCADGAEVHALIDTMMVFGFYRSGERLLDTVEAGVSPYSDFAPIVHEGVPDRRRLAARAKKFAPVVSSPRWRPRLWTVNVGYGHESGPVDLTLTLRRPGDAQVHRHRLAPGAARLWNLEEEFALAGGPERTVHETVWLESRDANLFAIYMYEDRNDPQCFGLDHLTGG